MRTPPPTFDPSVLLSRLTELERKLKNQRERTYKARRSRDHWRNIAMERAADARAWRRWKASA